MALSNNLRGVSWETVVGDYQRTRREDLWRMHLQKIYRDLIDSWIGHIRGGIVLKTDLFDEAISSHNPFSLVQSQCKHIVGIDAEKSVVQHAVKKISNGLKADNHMAVVADIICLALKSNAFDWVLSFSTLDHFDNKRLIFESLNELHRVLKPGGTLIITLDNQYNPLVLLRNLLPFQYLKAFGIIPFPMGVTLTESELRSFLNSNGFHVEASAAIVHSPRILAIRVGQLLNKLENQRLTSIYFKFLERLEIFQKLPSRYITGYFSALKATKQ